MQRGLRCEDLKRELRGAGRGSRVGWRRDRGLRGLGGLTEVREAGADKRGGRPQSDGRQMARLCYPSSFSFALLFLPPPPVLCGGLDPLLVLGGHFALFVRGGVRGALRGSGGHVAVRAPN